MELPSVDIALASLLAYLLPGFITAWLFFALTAHPKTNSFERVVQALIFTVLIQAMTATTRWICLIIGPNWSVGEWTDKVGLLWSIANAFVLGLVFALFANKDWFHALLRKIGLTVRTSFPSEWFSAFNRDKRYVILHFKDKRRLHGWPEEWPDHADTGHFVINQPCWLLDNGERAPFYATETMVVPVCMVEMVERMKRWEEITASNEDLQTVADTLLDLRENGETEDGKQSTSAAAPTLNAAAPEHPSFARPGVDGEATNATNESTGIATTTSKDKLIGEPHGQEDSSPQANTRSQKRQRKLRKQRKADE